MRTLETALELSPESIEVLTTLALLNLDMGNSGRVSFAIVASNICKLVLHRIPFAFFIMAII